ncbi:MAG: hypothetical protein ACOYM3_04590 [Terrimicrobiaceae bacterium]
MNNFPFSDSPLPRRRLEVGTMCAALGIGIVGGAVIVFIAAKVILS